MSKSLMEKDYVQMLKEKNYNVNAIADAALIMLQKRRGLKGNQTVLTEIAAIEFCAYLVNSVNEGDEATRTAAERLLRKELWYAYDLGYIDVIYKIEPEIAMMDL